MGNSIAIIVTMTITEKETAIAFARKRTRRIFRARFSPHRVEGGTYVDGRSPEVLREMKKRAAAGNGGAPGDKGFIRGSLLLPLKSLACCR